MYSEIFKITLKKYNIPIYVIAPDLSHAIEYIIDDYNLNSYDDILSHAIVTLKFLNPLEYDNEKTNKLLLSGKIGVISTNTVFDKGTSTKYIVFRKL